MFVCEQCGYNTTDSSNFKRHCNRKTQCSGEKQHPNVRISHPNVRTNVRISHPNVRTDPNVRISHPNVSNEPRYAGAPKGHGFTVLNNDQVICVCCKKTLLKVNTHRHVCRGAPLNTCPFCFKKFKHRSSLAFHKKNCTQNQDLSADTHIPETNGNTIINNTTINNNTVINVINIQFGNENIQELLLKAEHDERFLALSTKLREKQNIQIEIDALIASKDDYDSDRHYELVLQEKHKTDELFHVLMDLVYFNEDIPQNHTIRKTNKKSDMIEIRDNELWNPMPTNSVVKTILNPICKLAQGMADVSEDMFATKKYTKQNFNEIMYSKTQRGYLTEQRILQPYEKRQLDTSSSEWKAFSDEVYRSFTPCRGHNLSDLKRETVLEQLQATAVKYNLDDFCPERDGDPIFQDILKRWTDFFKQ